MAVNGTIVHSRERLAWTTLLIGFACFVALATAVPLSVNAYLQNATRPLNTAVQVSQGIVSIDYESGARNAVLPEEPLQPVEAGARIFTNAMAVGVLSVYPPGDERLLARLQLYGNSDVHLEQATAPRFGPSDAAQELRLVARHGRLRIVTLESGTRPFVLVITTPHGVITIRQPGQYSLLVNANETQVTVQAGSARVTAVRQSLDLRADERAEIYTDSAPVGPLGLERNLIQNGDFNDRWRDWTLYAWTVERPDLPVGKSEIVSVEGEPALHIVRDGVGHADVAIRQLINQDVTDFQTLLLELDIRILHQSLDVCGNVGSECPLTILIEYEDVNGSSQVWQQGFYAVGESGGESTPDQCVTCSSPRFEHFKVAPGQFAFYQADLITALQQKGALPPGLIKSVSLIGAGHSFQVEVLEVALIAKELGGEN
jgi:hypothetical protein